MYVNGRYVFFFCLVLCANLTGCQSAVTHEYYADKKLGNSPSATLGLAPSIDLEINNTKTEQLNEEPILPMNSSESLPMLTPASYYHSPDPPEVVPEYIPSIFFNFDSWILTDKGKHMLELTAAQLKDDQEITLIIEGHCDAQGSEGYNLVLGDKRALAIKTYLVGLGIAEDRLIPVSFGETHPVCFEDHETCHSLNRRGYLVSSIPSAIPASTTKK